MSRAYSFLELKALDSEQRTIEGWASRPETDRVGDIVESKGASFRLPLPLLLDHNHTQAVGDVFEAKVSAEGIRFKARIAKIAEPGAIKDLCDSAWSAAKAGLRRAVSIGFRPIATEPLATGGMRFTKWDWYELSMVSVPALASATIDQVKAYDRELLRARGRVVRLGDSTTRKSATTRVVRLNENEPIIRSAATKAGRSIVDAMSQGGEDYERRLSEAAEMLRQNKAIGGSSAMLVAVTAAGAKAVDAELAELRARLAQLERKG